MITPLKLALAQQLKKLNSVKNCSLTNEGVLSANLWSGAAVHVYDLDQPLKPRQIRKILQETTRLGIGVLFIVDHRLVPPDGERLEPAEWLTILHEVSGDRIYTYRWQETTLILGQIHFRAYGGALREVWYGPDVVPAALPFYRVWAQSPAIRGSWLVANFGNELFWKQQRFRVDRDVDQQHHDAQRVNGWSSERVYGAYADKTTPFLQETKLDMAYKLLGVKRDATAEEVKAVFRKLARECHPDTSPLPKDEAERRFRSVTEAYTYIRQTNGW